MLDQLPSAIRADDSTVTGGDATEALFAQMDRLPRGDPRRQRIRSEIVDLHAPDARQAARRYAHRGEPVEDLEQAAFLGLVKAINGFDPARGHRFIVYASVVMTGEVKRHFRDNTWRVHVPRRLSDLCMVLKHTAGEFIQQHGRSPTAAEISELMSLTKEETNEVIIAAAAYRTESLDVPHTQDRDSEPIANQFGADDPALDYLINIHTVHQLINELSDRERKILFLSFFCDHTQAQIGKRLGISQMHVSRLLKRGLERLRAGLLTDQPPGRPPERITTASPRSPNIGQDGAQGQ
jgi:RNA polymerase sigma-70 factor (sigma-B/F/G subfamily)